MAGRMTSILRHVAEVFPPARQGTILNNHRVICIATNTSVVLNCALVTYIMMTAEVIPHRVFISYLFFPVSGIIRCLTPMFLFVHSIHKDLYLF